MDPSITVRLAQAKADLDTCFRLRWTVFVEEQGVPPSLELDEHDRDPRTIHALGLLSGVPVGAGRAIFQGGGVAKIGRLAVIGDARGRGLGLAILRFLEDEARRRGATTATLGAQLHARGFYGKQGYAAVGDIFDDAGIEHVEMKKKL